MLAGELYNAAAQEIQPEQVATAKWLAKYNGPFRLGTFGSSS
jgi:Maltose acetyltransferase